jgi:hypothetical protein
VPVTEQPDIQKFFINVMYDAQFVVDGALAVRLCGAFSDVFKDKEVSHWLFMYTVITSLTSHLL